MSIYDKKEPTEKELMQKEVDLLDKRLNALALRIEKEPDMNLVIELIRLRSNLMYKRKALLDRLSNSTQGNDIMQYNIKAVLTN